MRNRSYLKAVALAVVLLPAAIAVRPAAADTRTEAFVFGDSLSDSGNFYALNGGVYPPAPFYYDGRFSDGPVWWEYFVEMLGIHATDLAVAGAFTGDRNESDGAFTGNPATEQYPGLSDQVTAFLAARPQGVNPDALYVLWAGPNDLIEHLGLVLATGDQSYINPVEPASNLAASIAALASHGARYFMVPSMPNLSVVPRVLHFPTPLQAQVFALSYLYKTVIESVVANTVQQLGVTLVSVDSFGLLTTANANPGAYGFTQVTTECLVRPDPLNPYGWIPCVAPGSPAPQGWFFWDDLHPTTQGHRFIGQAFAASFRRQFCGLDPETITGGREDQEAPPLWRGVCYRTN